MTDFPLISEVMGDSAGGSKSKEEEGESESESKKETESASSSSKDDSSDSGDSNEDENGQAQQILNELNELSDYIYPQIGADFGAIGIKANAYQMIDGFALLVVAVGSHFELDLLGMAQMSFPISEGGTSGPVPPQAFVEVALEATIDISDGYFLLAAQLTDHSYVLDKNCHITGGMAFEVWYGGDHAGDFVVTLGGVN